MTTKEVKEIELDIPIDKINDLAYLQDKFLNVSFQLLKELSDHSDKSFVDMINEFIPDEDCITDAFLNQWGLSKSDITLKTKKTKIRKKTKKTPKKETPDSQVSVEIKVNTQPETAVVADVQPETKTAESSAVKVSTKKKIKPKKKRKKNIVIKST